MSLPLIEEGLAALRDGDAGTARRAFEFALAEAESGEVLEGLAEALYLEREYAASAAHYERAYAAHRRERNAMAAGRAARTLAWITGNVLGDWAVRNGWLARARTILEQTGEDRPEHGWVLIIKAFSEPDAQVREALLRRSRHRIPGAVVSRWPLRHDRSCGGGTGLLRRGAGGALRRRADGAGHGGRDLLRTVLGV